MGPFKADWAIWLSLSLSASGPFGSGKAAANCLTPGLADNTTTETDESRIIRAAAFYSYRRKKDKLKAVQERETDMTCHYEFSHQQKLYLCWQHFHNYEF